MKAACWLGKNRVKIEQVPDPQLLTESDVIVEVSSTAICGSDLHLYNGYVPSMMKGDILGHEFMGEVVDIGRKVEKLKMGDRVVVPFPIACGRCASCQEGLYSACENSNPNAWMAEKMWGHSPAGIFGYSHLLGGYAGGQAEYVRVPFADNGPLRVPETLSDEQVLFLSDVLPTGYMAAENCGIKEGDTVAVWGCGPVGLLAVTSAFLLGAQNVVAIDRFPSRLRKAQEQGASVLNYEECDVRDELLELTAGRGPDSCIDATGMEAHAPGVEGAYDNLKQSLRLETDRPAALRQAIMACANGGTVSVVGVYGGASDKIPLGSLVNRSLTLKTGQTPVQRYMQPLLGRIEQKEIDPTFIITHRASLDAAPELYEMFKHKEDECIKVVMKP